MFLIFLALPHFLSPIFAEAGRTGAPFLRLGLSARAAGMAEAYVGLANAGNILPYNPAAGAFFRRPEMEFSHQERANAIRLEAAGLSLPLGQQAAISASLAGLYHGGLVRTEADPVEPDGFRQVGSFSAYDLSAAVGFSRWFVLAAGSGQPMLLALGGSVKAIHSRLDTASATTAAADLGVMLRIQRRANAPLIRVGLAGYNLGPNRKFESEAERLPMAVAAGGSAQLLRGRLVMAGSVYDVPPERPELRFGLEGWPWPSVALRLGYVARTRSRRMGALDGLTSGLGLLLGRWRMDYALLPNGELGFQHFISVGWRAP